MKSIEGDDSNLPDVDKGINSIWVFKYNLTACKLCILCYIAMDQMPNFFHSLIHQKCSIKLKMKPVVPYYTNIYLC